MHELPDDESAIEFYGGYIKDLPLAFDENTIFEMTIYEGTREVTSFSLDKHIDELPTPEIELIYA